MNLADDAIDAVLATRGLHPSEAARPAIRSGVRRLHAAVARIETALSDAEARDVT